MDRKQAPSAQSHRPSSELRPRIVTLLILAVLILAFLALWLWKVGSGYFGSYIDRNEQIDSVMSLNGGLTYAEEEAQRLVPLQLEWDDFRNTHLSDQVWTVAQDGSRLSGVYYDQKGSCTVLVLPRYNGTAQDDFLYGSYFAEAGFNLLLTDPRAHGNSEGEYCGFGYLEQGDVDAWVSMLEKEYSCSQIIIYGEGMGANAALFYAGQGDISPAVRFMIVESPYSSLKEQAIHTLDSVHGLPYFPFGLAIAWALDHGNTGYQLKDVQLDSVSLSGAELPALFIWGEEDDYIPSQLSSTVYTCYPGPKECVTASCRHGMVYAENQTQLEQTILNWCEDCLSH